MTIVQSDPITSVPDGPVAPVEVFSGVTVTSIPGSGASADYVHRQDTPASTWNIDHDLGVPREPVVILDDDPDMPVWTDTYHPTVNHTDLVFPQPVTGWAYF